MRDELKEVYTLTQELQRQDYDPDQPAVLDERIDKVVRALELLADVVSAVCSRTGA